MVSSRNERTKSTLMPGALVANLEETKPRNHIAESFDNDEKKLLSLTKVYSGLHLNLEKYLTEFYHPYTNTSECIELLRKIFLEDGWQYVSSDISDELLKHLLKICKKLNKRKMDDRERIRLSKTVITFIPILLQGSKDDDKNLENIRSFIYFLQEILASSQLVNINSSATLKKSLLKFKDHPLFGEILTETIRLSLHSLYLSWDEVEKSDIWLKKYKKGALKTKNCVENILKENFKERFFFEMAEKVLSESSQKLAEYPDINDIASKMRRISDSIPDVQGKIYFLFYLIDISMLDFIREHLLFDINRTLKKISFESDKKTASLIKQIFQFFKILKSNYCGIVLDCIKTLGIETVKKGSTELIDQFSDMVIDFGFSYPEIKGIDSNWQTISNKDHIKNVRTYLKIIEQDPVKTTKLISSLLINLKIGGVFISDTDLFQKDITELLNSDFGKIYHLIKQIAVLFPVYFNEIGAEGELRDISTEIDEITSRKDKLIHFLRKQIHAESNNTQIKLTGEIFKYWTTLDPSGLLESIPSDVAEAIEGTSEFVKGLHLVCLELLDISQETTETIMDIKAEDIDKLFNRIKSGSELDKRKVSLLFRLHLLLKEKYYLNPKDVIVKLRNLNFEDRDKISDLENFLTEKEDEKAVKQSFLIIRKLKETVLDPEKSEGIENIYHKRHIAIGIPSMYGNYREKKFESLGMIFRLEQLVTNIIENMISDSEMSYLSSRTLEKAVSILELFREGLDLGGITSENFNSNLLMLQHSLLSSSFSIGQYINIFEFMAESIKKMIVDYFLGIHDVNLQNILRQYLDATDGLSSREPENTTKIHSLCEEFYRSVISSSFLVQQIDTLNSSLLSMLRKIPPNLSTDNLQMILSYKKEHMIIPINKVVSDMDNQVFLGAKGYYLKKMYSYNFPIPGGFILSSELFRKREAFSSYPIIRDRIYSAIKKNINEIEKQYDLEFGNPDKILILSVRSGSAISMPGAMNTFLNVGLNDDIVEKLSKKPNYGWTSWDCYRRFIQTWGMSRGIDRDVFDGIMIHHKRKYGIKKKLDFSPAQMREIAFEYKKVVSENGISIDEDPFDQVIFAVQSVFDSWYSERAETYRENLGIDKKWGTAVIIQKMVLGNINFDSGTGVVFTRDPSSGDNLFSLYGDFTLCSQGEDVVGGLVYPYPICEKQRMSAGKPPEFSLEKDYPDIYGKLYTLAKELVYERGYGHQEIEFTFETSKAEDLHILQTRPYILKRSQLLPIFRKHGKLLAEGVGIGGGAMNGRIVFNGENLDKCRKLYPKDNRILVKPDTVSDDIALIFDAEGILTSRGGATSHAAVTAVRLNKTGVVNCRELKVNEKELFCTIGGHEYKAFDKISIDGRLGQIFEGYGTIENQKIIF